MLMFLERSPWSQLSWTVHVPESIAFQEFSTFARDTYLCKKDHEDDCHLELKGLRFFQEAVNLSHAQIVL